MLAEAGEMVAMMEVLVLPPNDSCNRRVSLLSLQVCGISMILLCHSIVTDVNFDDRNVI